MLLLVTPPPTTPSLAHAPPVNVNVNKPMVVTAPSAIVLPTVVVVADSNPS